MRSGPSFFLPGYAADEQEAKYVELAKKYGASQAASGDRIWSITWEHDGDIWKATIGEPLTGLPDPRSKRGTQFLTDAATPIAIYPGHCYIVVTDGVRSWWNNPIYIGKHAIKSFVLFG